MTITRETPFGTVTILPESVHVSAHAGQIWSWANRAGAAWPCSTLERLPDGYRCDFDSNGLFDQEAPGLSFEDFEDADIDGHEMSAWSSDAIDAAGLPEDHPCWFVTVGQYRG